MRLTEIERFSLTNMLLKDLDRRWNCQPILREVGTRFVGFVVIPFTGIIDTIAHIVLFTGKTITGIVVTPYNFAASRIFPRNLEYLLSRDLELGSALVHLAVSLHKFVMIVGFPLLIIVSPARATFYSDPANLFMNDFQKLADAFEAYKSR